MEWLKEFYMPIVLVACLCVGYVMKKWIPADDKWIPTVMVILGAVLGCVAQKEISLLAVVSGAVSGLASTGLHQLFKQHIEAAKVASVLKDEEVAMYLLDKEGEGYTDGDEVE